MRNFTSLKRFPKWATQWLSLFFTACTLVLISFPGYLNAQVANRTKAELLQLRQKNSFNKTALKNVTKQPVLPAAPFAVAQADASTNPLANIIQSLVGPGVTVSNIQTNLPATSNIYGSFTGGTNVVGMETGLLMTSGSVLNALGPNISPSTSQDNGLPGYLTLDTAGFDAAVISFDVTSTTSFLSFNYVFASEEYNEYVGSVFNDEFAFFISGPGIPAGTNIALIPGTSTPVAINNVNLGLNSQYYINNDSSFNADPFRFQNLEYDGLTKVLNTAAISVVPGATYTITLVIQDVSDPVYDSGVFIEGGSITSDSCVLKLYTEKKDISCNGANDGTIELSIGGANGVPSILWSNGATTKNIEQLAAGSYNVAVTDEKGCKATLSSPVVINEPAVLTLNKPLISNGSCSGGSGSVILSATGGTTPYSYTVGNNTNDSGIFNDLPPGNYSYSVTDAHGCIANGSFTIQQGSNIACSIAVIPYRTVPGQAPKTIYIGHGQQYVTLKGTATNGTGPYTYDWGSAGSGRYIQVSPVVTTTYNLTVTDATGCSSYCSVTINVVDVRCGKLLNRTLICYKDSLTNQWVTKCVDSAKVCRYLRCGAHLGACTNTAVAAEEMITAVSEKPAALTLKALPNPSSGSFTLQILTNNVKDKISLRVTDFSGRQIEAKEQVTPGQFIKIGANYKAGTYIAELIQGNQRATIKLIRY